MAKCVPDLATLSKVIDESTARVLETMFFTSIVEEDAIRPEPREDVGATLTFSGEPSGFLSLVLSMETSEALAEAFAGLDREEITDLQREEILNELANIICGSILSKVESDSAFALGPPRPVGPADARVANRSDTHFIQRSFNLGNGVLTVILGMETPA